MDAGASPAFSFVALAPENTLMRIITILLVLAASSLHAQAPDSAEADRNVELLAKYYDHGRRGEHDQQVALWSKDAINNGERAKLDEVRAALEDIRRAFPDYESTVLEMRAIGDTVVALSRISGTHRGVAQTSFFSGVVQGAKATGKRFEVLVTHWWRFRDGKIVWHQATRDDLGIGRQLGLIPPIAKE
jgi:predicted ester cyclase